MQVACSRGPQPGRNHIMARRETTRLHTTKNATRHLEQTRTGVFCSGSDSGSLGAQLRRLKGLCGGGGGRRRCSATADVHVRQRLVVSSADESTSKVAEKEQPSEISTRLCMTATTNHPCRQAQAFTPSDFLTSLWTERGWADCSFALNYCFTSATKDATLFVPLAGFVCNADRFRNEHRRGVAHPSRSSILFAADQNLNTT